MNEDRIQGLVTEISKEELVDRVLAKKAEGCRLVQICAAALEGATEMDYSFADPENKMESFRFNVAEDDEVVSISSIFPCSFLYENEIKELFGVTITHISIDFDNKLYRIEAETPFKKGGKK